MPASRCTLVTGRILGAAASAWEPVGDDGVNRVTTDAKRLGVAEWFMRDADIPLLKEVEPAFDPNGGPDNTTRTMSQELFNTAFRKGQFGYATAMGVVLAAVTLLFAAIVFTINRLTGGGERKLR